MKSKEQQQRKPKRTYDVSVRPINPDGIASIENLVGRFISHGQAPVQETPLISQIAPIQQTEAIAEVAPATDLLIDHSDLGPDLKDQRDQDQELKASIQQTPPVYQTVEPLSNRHETPSIQQTPPIRQQAPVSQTVPIQQTEARGVTQIPNSILDKLLPQLEAYEQIVYLRLYRLSHGFHRDNCLIGVDKLSKSCNLSTSTIIRTLKSLEAKNLIKKLETKLGGKMTEIRGNHIWVYKPSVSQTPPIQQTAPSYQTAGISQTPIKDDDDHINKDHHQSAHARETMTIYQSITGNNWSKADAAAYDKIKHLPVGVIEQGIRVAMSRAASRPGSLAYFVKEILAIANPAPASIAQRRRELAAIVARIRASHTGQVGYSIADFSADVKEACAREGVVFDPSIFNELIG